MLDKELIKLIHNSELFGIIIEMGCGSPISHKLCEIEGASNTIFLAENPYSAHYSRSKYEIPSHIRLVSLSAVDKILISKQIESIKKENSHINMIIILSFQLEENSSHGWIVIEINNEPKYYHLTLPCLSRKEKIDLIGKNIIYLLNNLIDETTCVNIVYDSSLVENKEEIFKHVSKSYYNSMVYIKENKFYRLEDLLRSNKEGIVIYKGSFNPPSITHIEIAEKIQKKYPNYKLVFSISTDTFSKGNVDEKDLIKRCELICDLGYDILVYNKPRFAQMLSYIKEIYKGEIIFPMGSDTYERLKSELIFNKELEKRIHVIERTNLISSSKIREKIKLNQENQIIEDIPIKIREKVVNWYK